MLSDLENNSSRDESSSHGHEKEILNNNEIEVNIKRKRHLPGKDCISKNDDNNADDITLQQLHCYDDILLFSLI